MSRSIFLKSFSRTMLAFWAPLIAYLLSLSVVGPWGDFPLNDDWVYAKDALMTFRSKALWVTGFESAWGLVSNVVGALISSGFGFSHVHLRWFGVFSAVGSASLLFLLLRRRGVDLWVSSAGVCSFLFFAPGYIVSVSFMTDMPFVFLWLLTAWCFERGLAERSRLLMAAGTVACVLCSAQRQFGLFLALSLGFHLYLSSARYDKKFFRVAIVAVGASCLAFVGLAMYWRMLTSLPSAPVLAKVSFVRIVMNFHSSVIFFALAIAPLVALKRRRLKEVWGERGGRAAAVFLGLFLVASTVRFAIDPMSPFFSNQISIYGLFNQDEVLFGERPAIFGWGVKLAMVGAALVVLAEVLSEVRKRLSTLTNVRAWDETSVLILASVGYFMYSALRAALFDRYLLPAFPAAILLVASYVKISDSRSGRVIAGVLLLVYGVFSVTLTHDYFRWSEAKWKAAESVPAGVPPLQIAGGYEWHGWHGGRTSHPSLDPSVYFYLVSFSELPGKEVVGRFQWSSIWGPSEREIFLLRNVEFMSRRQK